VPSGGYLVIDGAFELWVRDRPTGVLYTDGAFLGEFHRFTEGMETAEDMCRVF
jgi:hypothetical protein